MYKVSVGNVNRILSILCVVLMSLMLCACMNKDDEMEHVGETTSSEVEYASQEMSEDATTETQSTEEQATEEATVTEEQSSETLSSEETSTTTETDITVPETSEVPSEAPSETPSQSETVQTPTPAPAPQREILIAAADMFNTFSVSGIDGATYTEAVFAQADLNVVILTTTYCGYCDMELPALQRVMEAYSGRSVQFFNIFCDEKMWDMDLGTEHYQEKIAGITFPSLIYNSSIGDGYMATNTAYPKTLYLDSQGNLLDQVTGAAASCGEDYAVGVHSSIIEDLLSN